MAKIFFKVLLLLLLAGCAASKKTKFDDYVFKTKSEKQVYINSYDQALKLWDIPYTEENIPTTYGTAHIIISGVENGKDLVLLHGMDASSTMWYPNIKTLSKTHRIYAIDFIMEPGKSTLTTKPLSSEEIVILYNEIFNHYKLKNIDLIGASRGGWIATLLATQKENSIDKIVLLSPAQTFKSVDKVRKMTPALLLKLFPNEKNFEKTLKIFSIHPEKISPVYKRQFYLANKYAKSNSSMLKMRPFSDEELKFISNPVLILIGDHDVINSKESLERAQKLLVNGTTKTIHDAGHFLSIDQSKAVNEQLIEFLNPKKANLNP